MMCVVMLNVIVMSVIMLCVSLCNGIMFSGKARSPPKWSTFQILPSWKASRLERPADTNTATYYEYSYITTIKKFYNIGPSSRFTPDCKVVKPISVVIQTLMQF
jgi:hypothetical protein